MKKLLAVAVAAVAAATVTVPAASASASASTCTVKPALTVVDGVYHWNPDQFRLNYRCLTLGHY